MKTLLDILTEDNLCLSIGNIYTIGGTHNPRFRQTPGRQVSKMNLQSGRMETIQQLPHDTSFAAVATSPDMIVVCGGTNKGLPTSRCHILSSTDET